MRLVLFIIIVVLCAVPAAAQTCASWADVDPGEWCQVPGASFASAVPCGTDGYLCPGGEPTVECEPGTNRGVDHTFEEWGAGVYDSTRKKLTVWGGGHGGGCDNSFFEFDTVTLTWSYASPIDPNVTSGGECTTVNNRPKSPHAYDMLVAFENRNEMCSVGLSAPYPGTGNCYNIYCQDISARDPQNNVGAQGWVEGPGITPKLARTAWYNNVLYFDGGAGSNSDLFSWNGVAGTVTNITDDNGVSNPITPNDSHSNGEIDPDNQDFWVLSPDGPGEIWKYDLATGTKTSGYATPPVDLPKTPGFVYDTSINKFVIWAGGSTTYTYDVALNEWDACPATSGTPSAPRTNGTGGRWAYVPHENGYILVNNANEDMWLYKLPDTCTAAGTGCPGTPTDCECNDGLDNDGDLATDWPADGGCTSATDDDETNCPDGVCEGGETWPTCVDCAPIPECDDLLDNDGDGAVDLADAGCVDAQDDSEVNCGDGVCSPGEGGQGCTADCGTASAPLWETVDISFANTTITGNPFDIDFTATFTRPSTGTITHYGYYDGGVCSEDGTTRCVDDTNCTGTCDSETWKLKFMCDETGTWTYLTDSTAGSKPFLGQSHTLAADADLDGLSGSINCGVSLGSKGPMDPVNKRWRFRENLEYVSPLAYQIQYFFRNPTLYGHTAQTIIDWLTTNGATMIETDLLRLDRKGSNPNYFQTVEQGDRIYEDITSGDPADPDVTRFWLPTWDRMNEFLDLAARNDVGAMIRLYGDGENGPGCAVGACITEAGADEFRLMRYILARLAPYPTIVWESAIDISESRSNQWIDDWIQWMTANDPWTHPVASRSGGGSGGIDSTFATHWSAGEPDAFPFPSMTTTWNNETRSIFWTDHWRDNHSCSQPRGRWCTSLDGWLADGGDCDLLCTPNNRYHMRGIAWEIAFVPGGSIMGNRKSSFSGGSANITQHEIAGITDPFEAAPDIQIRNDFLKDLSNYGSMVPDRTLTNGEVYAASDLKDEFMFYVLQSQAGAAFTANLSTATGTATTALWYNTTDGTTQFVTDTITNGAAVTITPPDSNDWALHIEFDNPTFIDNLSPAATVFDTATQTSIGYRIPVNYINDVAKGLVPSDNDYDATVTVRYRTTSGPGAWVVGPDASRVRDTPEIVGDAVPSITDHFGGAIWGLTENTSYDVEFTITDPDGYSETRVDVISTVADPITTGTTTDSVSTLADLRELLDGNGTGDAVAGDIIEVTASLTNDATPDMVTVDVSGASLANPIIVSCTSRSIVLDSNGQDAVFQLAADASYLYFENCTLASTGQGGYAIRGATNGGHNGIVIRENIIRHSVWENAGNFGGIRIDGNNLKQNTGLYIFDNLIEGPNSHPIRRTGRAEGIRIAGEGNTIARNLVRGFGDSIGFRSTGGAQAVRNTVIYGNDVQFSKDDCIEGDGNDMLIVHDNRCQNYNACFSCQPIYGGPIYFTRNLCWTGGETRQLKLAGDPLARLNHIKIWNNLLPIGWTNYAGTNNTFSFDMRNNLFVGQATTSFVIDSSTQFWGFNNGNDATTPPAQPAATWDYNRYSYDGSFRVGAGSDSSLANFQAGVGYEANGAIIGEPIFLNSQTPYPDTTDSVTFFSISDPRPHASSDVIDNGVAINGITTGFAGAAPDIGPIESGDSIYPYGLSSWSYTAVHCNDGIDNDRDGNIDLADDGCASGTDPSEKGTIHVCDNGIDEDDDGLYDYPDDDGCSGPTDTTETAGGGATCGDLAIGAGEQCDSGANSTDCCADPGGEHGIAECQFLNVGRRCGTTRCEDADACDASGTCVADHSCPSPNTSSTVSGGAVQ